MYRTVLIFRSEMAKAGATDPEDGDLNGANDSLQIVANQLTGM